MDFLYVLVNGYAIAVFTCLLNQIVIFTGLVIADMVKCDRAALAAAVCNYITSRIIFFI